MKIADYTAELLKIYDVFSVLSDRNGKKVLRLRHKTLGKELVYISFENAVSVYRLLKDVRSENIVSVYDYLKLDDGYVVLEEYISGIPVSQVLETGFYSYSGAKTVLKKVCSALDVLHSQGFVYRDLKPENVIVADDGQVKLIDFDSCRIFDPSKASDTVALGTPGYASPEQYGVAQSDPRSDVYSAGVLLNVMLTGVHPSERLAKGKAGRIVLKCTQISPEKRYASVRELSKVL